MQFITYTVSNTRNTAEITQKMLLPMHYPHSLNVSVLMSNIAC